MGSLSYLLGAHPILLGVCGFFKLWMVVDLMQRGGGQGRGGQSYWFWVILWMPFGEWAYFFVVMRPELMAGFERKRRGRPLPVDTLRYRYRENPCTENAADLADGVLDESPSEAATLYEEILQRDPAYLRALHGLGHARLAFGKLDAAEDAFRRVLERESGYADRRVWLELAEVLQRAGRPEEAVDVLQELVRKDPRLHHVIALASALAAAGRTVDALSTLQNALEDHRHAPRHVRRFARHDARQAAKLLASFGSASRMPGAAETAAG